MKYKIKCVECGKEKNCEPTFENGIAIYQVSFCCDKCKKILFPNNNSDTLMYVETGEPYIENKLGSSLLSRIIHFLKK